MLVCSRGRRKAEVVPESRPRAWEEVRRAHIKQVSKMARNRQILIWWMPGMSQKEKLEMLEFMLNEQMELKWLRSKMLSLCRSLRSRCLIWSITKNSSMRTTFKIDLSTLAMLRSLMASPAKEDEMGQKRSPRRKIEAHQLVEALPLTLQLVKTPIHISLLSIQLISLRLIQIWWICDKCTQRESRQSSRRIRILASRLVAIFAQATCLELREAAKRTSTGSGSPMMVLHTKKMATGHGSTSQSKECPKENSSRSRSRISTTRQSYMAKGWSLSSEFCPPLRRDGVGFLPRPTSTSKMTNSRWSSRICSALNLARRHTLPSPILGATKTHRTRSLSSSTSLQQLAEKRTSTSTERLCTTQLRAVKWRWWPSHQEMAWPMREKQYQRAIVKDSILKLWAILRDDLIDSIQARKWWCSRRGCILERHLALMFSTVLWLFLLTWKVNKVGC